MYTMTLLTVSEIPTSTILVFEYGIEFIYNYN